MTSVGMWRSCVFLSACLGIQFQLLVHAAEPPGVSFHRDLVPILKRSCTGCHHPGKLKGNLDLTSHAAFKRGGGNGPAFEPGKPDEGTLLGEIEGDEPNMPAEGDPLSREEVRLFRRWIEEGALDDTPVLPEDAKPKAPGFYSIRPAVTALALSPDGTLIAVPGYHEVILIMTRDGERVARLAGDSPRIEWMDFSPDGRRLIASGGAPAGFGEIQVWDVERRERLGSFKSGNDCLYGASLSPDGTKIAVGGTDRAVRVMSVEDGREILKFDHHSDWVLGTAFTLDGRLLLSGGRDRSLKLVDLETRQSLGDVNKPVEALYGLARHPKEDWVAAGGESGTPRIHRMSDPRSPSEERKGKNLVREFERQPGPISCLAFSAEGTLLAVGGVNGEIRIYNTADGTRVASLREHDGAVFALRFHPRDSRLYSGGHDGRLRVFELPSGALLTTLDPAPLAPAVSVQPLYP